MQERNREINFAATGLTNDTCIQQPLANMFGIVDIKIIKAIEKRQK